MDNIEVEVKSFISEEQYNGLLAFFQKEGQSLYQDNQETHYLDHSKDIRIQKNDHNTRIWLKKGKMHDEQREEIEILCKKEDFDKIEKLFRELGFNTKIKWIRKRNAFLWKGLTVTVDHTKGYGYIIEIEKMAGESDKDAVLRELYSAMEELKIPITPKEQFEEKFRFYQQNWKTMFE